MTNGPAAGSAIPITSVPNLRDLGGWPTHDGGRVIHGLLFRSTDLAGLADSDLPAFEALGIRSVFDLRTEAERTDQPDRVPAGTDYVVADVLRDAVGAGTSPAQLFALLADATAAESALGDGKALALFSEAYRQIAGLPSAQAAYRVLFSGIDPSAGRPALFHCTTGKDRTGWAAAAMLTLLGVPEVLVMREYLLTNDQLLPSLQPMFDRFREQGGNTDVLRQVMGVEPAYLTAAMDQMRTDFGTIEEYFERGLGIDADGQRSLRAALVEYT